MLISLMAYGREWTGRIEHNGGEKRMAWSYHGAPAAAKQHVRQTLAPRAQLILSVDPSAIREDVMAAATSVAEEVRLSVHLACQLAFLSTCLRAALSFLHSISTVVLLWTLVSAQEALVRARSAGTEAEMAALAADAAEEEAAEAAAAAAAVAMADSEEEEEDGGGAEAARRRQLAAALVSGDGAAGGAAGGGARGGGDSTGMPKWFRGTGR